MLSTQAFNNDIERLEHLFKLYEKMIAEEASNPTPKKAKVVPMPDFFKAEYNQTGNSKKTNELGMREMQQIAFGANSAQYLLIKAPPLQESLGH